MQAAMKEHMISNIEENKAFAKWLRDWIALIQQNRSWAEQRPLETVVGTNGQEHSEGAHLLGPKRRAACGRYLA